MSGQHTFLKSNKYVSEEEIRFQGTPLLDTYDEGLDYLAAHMPRYVRLFASPAVKRDENDTLLTVAWYGEDVGQMQVWESSDQTGKVRVAAMLRSFLSDLLTRIHRFDDPQARMILGWLNILSFDADMLVINGQPIITNWGIVPAGVASNADRMTHHLLHGIGQFLPENYDLADLSQLMMELNESPSDAKEHDKPQEMDKAMAGMAAGAVAGAGVAAAAAEAMTLALEKVRQKGGGRIILVSDGKDTSEGDPCAVARAHPDVEIDVVSLGGGDALSCVAHATGDKWIEPEQLGESLQSIMVGLGNKGARALCQ